MNFIDKIANYILEEGLDLEHLTVVLPSERAKKYLTAALFKAYGKPIVAPEIVTMDRWVKTVSNETVIDKTRALLRLFEIQLKAAKSIEDHSFDEFLTWGNILLSDYNEIDRYLLDADKVFRNLADIKEIEQWSFGDATLTDSQKRFMEFWDRLPGYYNALNESLSKSGVCYAGKSFKFLANNIDLLFKADKKRQFLFAGFNALSKAETSVLKQLDQMGRAHIIINADAYYLNSKSHEAGRFLRDLSQELDGKKLNFIENEILQKHMDVQLIECSQNTGQVKVASTILEGLSEEEVDDTLLLLADETLIGAILKNLPKRLGKANITLGLPIRNTAVRTWVDLIFSIQENKVRFKTNAIYFNDLQGFWNHPFLLAIIDEEEKNHVIEAEQNVIRQNKIFLNPENLNLGELSMKIVSLLTANWEGSWKKALDVIREMNTLIYAGLSKNSDFEKAIIERFDHSLIDYQNIIEEGAPEMSLKSFKHLFNQHWGMQRVAYHGNPMDGLQIMGLLETRGLDFKRIICVGMNEGQLPPTNPIQTMIPMDLRRYLGLPTPREKQGLFAHHFYRLLHRCEELHVTYCTAEDFKGSAEPSRYLMQLEMELSRINKNIKIHKKIYSLYSEKECVSKEIKKTPEIKHRMDELLSQSASASMFKKYTACPLDFYFRYIMGFGDAKSVEEELEHSTFGTFIHDTLEELYTPFAQFDKQGNKRTPAPTNITSFDVENMLKNFKLVLHQKFMKHFNNNQDSFMKGKNLLPYKMAIELTERFLNSEVKFLSEQRELVFIESLEQTYNALIPIEVNGEMKEVNFKGIIDRVDRVGDQVRIIDYKSGKVGPDDVAFRSKKDVNEEAITETLGDRKHVLQLIMYAFLYKHKHDILPTSSIISFISGNNLPFVLDTKKNELEEVIASFPKYIGRILSEMYDSEIPFAHKVKAQHSYCQYCD